MKIGRLIDHPTRHDGIDYGRRALDLVFDEVNRTGGIGSETVALVEIDAVGSVERVIDGARRLAADGCLLILGPSVTDFAVPLIPVLDELRIVGLNWSGSALARGAWGFQLKVGSLPDEAGHLTRLMALRRARRIAVARDRGPIGDEYFAYLRNGLAGLGIELAADVELVHERDPGEAVEPLRAGCPDTVLYLGLGPQGVALCRAMRETSWKVPIVGNIGLGVFPSPGLEGIVFTDVIDETNPVLERFARRYEERYGEGALPLGLAAAHDLALTAIEALRCAPSLTREGVRAGLESLRGLPAAVGAPGTTIGFAPWDRDGYKGPLVVYRTIRCGRAVSFDPLSEARQVSTAH